MELWEIRRNNLNRLLDTRFKSKQADLATALDRPSAYVWQLCFGKQQRFGEKIARYIEEKLNLIPYSLDGESFDQNVLENFGNEDDEAFDIRQIPLLSNVQAGNPVEAINSYLDGAGMDYIYTDRDLGRHAFGLIVKGNSMEPDYKEGDKVIVDPDIYPQAGSIVVAKCNGDEATIKKYRPRGINQNGDDVFELVPLNDDFATIRSDLVQCVIIGTVVEHRRYLMKAPPITPQKAATDPISYKKGMGRPKKLPKQGEGE